MSQSHTNTDAAERLHVAIIMDGNGRWANGRGLPRVFGHRAGADAVDRVVQAAPDLGIGTLTLFAFSSDNWQRPRAEVTALMKLFHRYLQKERERLISNGVRLSVIGRRDRLGDTVLSEIERTEAATAACRRMLLRVAIDYSARDSILEAARRLGSVASEQLTLTRDDFARLIAEATHSDPPASDVDLLIRTSGEQRLSDFLLWECAYAELVFTPTLWPDFDRADLDEALVAYRNRDRRFGRVRQPVAG